jgi:mannosyl-oligosaccharide glucosidase
MRLPAALLALLSTIHLPATVDADTATSNASLLWGPFRPNLYMGIRPRVPESLLAGLMWGKLEDVEKSMAYAA